MITQVTNLNKEVAIKNVLAGVAADKYYNYKLLTYVSATEVREQVSYPLVCDHYYVIEAKYRSRKVQLKLLVGGEGSPYIFWGRYGSPVKKLPGMKDWSFDIETLNG